MICREVDLKLKWRPVTIYFSFIGGNFFCKKTIRTGDLLFEVRLIRLKRKVRESEYLIIEIFIQNKDVHFQNLREC